MFEDIISFIRGMYGNEGFIPLHSPVFRGNEKKYLNDCIESTYVSSVGKYVDRFEDMIKDYTGTCKAVVCVNGTNALHMAMILAGINRDDEVLTQALTFVATCNAISYIGAQPVFLDVDKDTMGLSPDAVENWLKNNVEIKNGISYNKKSGRRVKACIPMHTFGHPVHLDKLVDVCNQFHLELIEDAAESLGSFYKGKHTGTFGSIGAISFNGNKTITTGGGGILLFKDERLGKFAKHLSTQAKIPHRWEFSHDNIGYNYRMPNINAAIGCAQLEQIDDFLSNKRKTAEQYQTFFSNYPEITFFAEPKNCKSNYWLNSIIFKDNITQQEFLEYTNNQNIATRPIWQLMNRLPMFANCNTGDLFNSEWFSERVVNLPSSVR